METNGYQYNNTFSANNIKKYWKNQSPTKITKNFLDIYFPHNSNSILAKDSNGNFIDPDSATKFSQSINAADIEWKRAGEIFDDYLLFDEKIEFDDINQGSLGNCYFLSAIAAISEFPEMIYQIFRTKEKNSEGYYEVILFIDGEWQIVFVDDYFPVSKKTNTFAFAKPNGNELWVILLEKVWAKINGGYANIISGWPSDPLSALTGFAVEKIFHKSQNPIALWETIKLSDKNDYIMCTSTKNDKNIEKYGLIVNHAYTLVGAKEKNYNGETIRLVNIRNPWGRVEWNGDWSDNSKLWTTQLSDYFNRSDKDDGTFFMEFNDFIKFFEWTHVCHSMCESNVKNFIVDSQNISKPHVYNLAIQEDNTRIAISIINKHWRYNRSLRYHCHPFAFMFAKFDLKTNQITNVVGKFFANDSYEYVKTLNKGLYVVWIYCANEYADNPKLTNYFVRFISPTKYRVKLETYDDNFECVRELMIAGIKSKYTDKIKENLQFYHCENSFDESGIGYRCVINNSDSTFENWSNDSTGIEGMFMLPPHNKEKNFEFHVPPKGYALCLGMRNKNTGTYWFNLKSNFESIECNPGTDPTNTKKIKIENFVSPDVFMDDINDSYYSYISSSKKNVKQTLEFTHIDTKDAYRKALIKDYPDLMNQLESLKPLHNEENLLWSKLTVPNGFYIGQQLKNKTLQGRGAFHSDLDGHTYIGYWESNNREKYGKLLNEKSQIVYEGGYKNGKKHGKGKIMLTNGDIYEGDYVDNKRTGNGIYLWKDGSSWKGTFQNDLMHGIGLYTPEDGSEAWDVEYFNGQAQ
jgi:hypothetical protein